MQILLYSLVGIGTLLGNCLLLAVVHKNKLLNHSQYVFKCSIAVSDVVMGVLGSVSQIHLLYQRFLLKSGKEFVVSSVDRKVGFNATVTSYGVTGVVIPELPIVSEHSLDMILLYSIVVSFNVMIFSSVDRYFALAFPFRYRASSSVKNAKLASAFSWATPSLWVVLLDVYKIKFTFVLIAYFVLLWFVNILTVCILVQSYKKAKSLNRVERKNKSREMTFSKVLVAMVVVFTLCFLPEMLIWYHRRSNITSSFVVSVENLNLSRIVLISSTCWNFVIYNLLNKTFRASVKNMFVAASSN